MKILKSEWVRATLVAIAAWMILLLILVADTCIHDAIHTKEACTGGNQYKQIEIKFS